jgi:act minimal PKS chain-length factor (CLF/KS beta)
MTAAVVTGLGIAAPNGLGKQDYWDATRGGKSGIGRLTRFDPARYRSRLAGEIPGFDPARHLPGRLIRQSDRTTQLSLVAADWALRDAGVDSERLPPYGMGVATAHTAGGFEFGQLELEKLWSLGGSHVSAYQSFAWFYAVNSGQISIRHGMKGPSSVVVGDHAGGLDAVAQARRQVRGGTPLMICGSVDGSICSWGWAAQLTSGRLSTAEEPDSAYLPFDRDAGGHVVGEGGALLVLEDERAARNRNARIYGEIAGYGATFDPRPGSGREPGLRAAIRIALDDAGVVPGEVGAVFADAAGVPALDRAEAEAIAAVFGVRGVPVCAPKTMTGRLGAGSGPLDLATAFLSMAEGVLPPAVNVEPDPSLGLDLVLAQPRPAEVRTALVLARGLGGFNSAVVARRP